jgi:hypothetical protein
MMMQCRLLVALSILLILVFASPAWALDADTYILNATGAGTWSATTADINDVSLDTDSPGQITASIASMGAGSGTTAVVTADPGTAFDVYATVNAGQNIAIPTTFFGQNINLKNLYRTNAGGTPLNSFLHEEEGFVEFENGSHEPVLGETVTGSTSAKTFVVVAVELVTGAWDGTGAGYIMYKSLSGALTDNEALQDSGATDIGDIVGDEDPDYPSVLGGRLYTMLDNMRAGLLRFPGSNEQAIFDDDNEVGYQGPPWSSYDVLRGSDIDRMYEICADVGCELYMRLAPADLNDTAAYFAGTQFCNGNNDPATCCTGDQAGSCTQLQMWQNAVEWIDNAGYTDISYIDLGNEPTLEGYANTAAGGEAWADKVKIWVDALTAVQGGLSLSFGSPEMLRVRMTANTSWWCDSFPSDHCTASNSYRPFLGDDNEGFLGELRTDSTELGIVGSHYYQKSGDYTVAQLLEWTTGSGTNLPHWDDYFLPALEKFADHHEWDSGTRPITVVGEMGPGAGSDGMSGQVDTVGAALWLADVFGRAGRAGVEALCFDDMTNTLYNVGNVWNHVLFANDFSTVHPLTLVYIMFDQWWGTHWVTDVTIADGGNANDTCGDGTEACGEGDLSVSAATDASFNIYVMVVNKRESDSLQVKITINTAGGLNYIDYTAPAHSVTVLAYAPDVSPPQGGGGLYNVIGGTKQLTLGGTKQLTLSGE